MTDADEFQTRLLRQLTSLLESQQHLSSKISEVIDRNGNVDAEFTKLSRQHHSIKSDLLDIRSDIAGVKADLSGLRLDTTGFRQEAVQRLGAINDRLEELETLSDRNAGMIREARIEATSHYNEILNAIQAGLFNSANIQDLEARVDAIERRIAP